jgi:isopentenyldiphosphate isomerase
MFISSGPSQRHNLEAPDDELVDVYDDSLERVGVATRDEAHRRGLWHLNLHCWIVTKRKGGAVLFQVRSEDKPTFAGLLDSTVGGHYKAGEKLEDVAREIEEEIGLNPDVEKLVPLGSRVDVSGLDGLSKREIAEVFFIRDDRPLRAYRVDPLEVRALVEVRIWDGLRLFSGRSKKIKAAGVEWDRAGKATEAKMEVTKKDFVPKMDSYYMTLFIMAMRLLKGDKYLSI